jgi:uroporphyrinogen decarboxylase
MTDIENKIPTKRLVRTLQGEVLQRPPIWLMRQAGRYLPEYRELRRRAPTFLDFCYSPSLAVEATLQPLRRYPLDAAIIFSDILVIPDAMGRKVGFEEGEGPRLEPLGDRAAVAALRPEHITTRLGPVYEALERVRASLEPSTSLIGFAGAPWTIATYMILGKGGPSKAEARLWAYQNQEAFHALLDILSQAISTHLIAQIDAGADAVQIFDSWADDLPASFFQRAVIDPTKKIVAAVRAARPQALIIGFPRGASARASDYAHETGISGVGLDTGADIARVREKLDPKIATQGNLDPQLMIIGGDMLLKETDRLLAAAAGTPHIFNLGHGITPQADPANVEMLVAHVQGAS